MKSNPRLMLPYDPQTEIYKFYEVMKITPVVVEDVLSMLLTIPLIDKSLQMNMYRVHNLPALHTKLGVAAEYNWKEIIWLWMNMGYMWHYQMLGKYKFALPVKEVFV